MGFLIEIVRIFSDCTGTYRVVSCGQRGRRVIDKGVSEEITAETDLLAFLALARALWNDNKYTHILQNLTHGHIWLCVANAVTP